MRETNEDGKREQASGSEYKYRERASQAMMHRHCVDEV